MTRHSVDKIMDEPDIDLETRLTDKHHLPLRTWLRMLSTTVKIETEIRSRLRVEFGITLPRFDLMAQLERHPKGLRMGAILTLNWRRAEDWRRVLPEKRLG